MSPQEQERISAAIEERYWYPSPEQFGAASDQLLQRHPDALRRYELCQNDLAEPIYVFSLGRGPRRVVLLARVHGHEPAGTCGLLALMDSLLSGREPGTEAPFEAAHSLLDEYTIECVPMANPDAARRFAAQVRNSYAADQFALTREDSERYMRVHSEPGLTFHKRRPPRFTPEELIAWRQTGKPLGVLYDEQGIELYRDWAHGRSMQIVALRELLRLRRPVLFVDIHTHERRTQVFLPAGLRSEDDRLRHERLGLAVYEALKRAGIPSMREVPPYVRGRPDLDNSTNWAYLYAGSTQFLFEIDSAYRWQLPGYDDPPATLLPALGKADMVMTVWHGIIALLTNHKALCGA